MRTKILVLVLICLFVFPLIAEEEIVFESVLKDVDFCLLPATKTDMAIIEDLKLNLGWWTWWILKFENGAVIVISRSALEPKEDIVWWIGKKYKVIKEKLYFRTELIEKE